MDQDGSGEDGYHRNKRKNDDHADLKEDVLSKRQKQLEKNREAAQLFRQRQREYIKELEEKVGTLETENNDHKNRLEMLMNENKMIKEQLTYLRKFLTDSLSVPNLSDPQKEN